MGTEQLHVETVCLLNHGQQLAFFASRHGQINLRDALKVLFLEF